MTVRDDLAAALAPLQGIDHFTTPAGVGQLVRMVLVDVARVISDQFETNQEPAVTDNTITDIESAKATIATVGPTAASILAFIPGLGTASPFLAAAIPILENLMSEAEQVYNLFHQHSSQAAQLQAEANPPAPAA
jgi:hypothetical protein